VTVTILPGDDAEARVWSTALEVARLFDDLPWVVIGAQMIMLLEREVGRPSGRTTGDVDAVVDVRILAGGMRAAADRLVAARFELGSAEHPYRFVRGAEQVDLLAPDHLGEHVDLTTVPPSVTTQIPGGSRALATARKVDVDIVGIGSGRLPVPSVAGAIVLKIHAWQARQSPRDAEDIVRLLALIIDVDSVRGEMKAAERRTLGQVAPLADRVHSAWRAVSDPDDARAAFARLSD
jgi:predicted nucleotidyltransferase